MKQSKKGFTLVELMIVIVIIGILAAIIIPSVSSAIEKAKVAKLQAEVKEMNTTLMVESIFDSVYAYRPEEVEQIIENAGFKLDETPKGYSIWYDQSNNQVVFGKTEEIFANGGVTSDLPITYAENDKSPIRIEALTGNPNLLYIDQTNTAIRTFIENMRNIINLAEADVIVSAENIDTQKTEFKKNINNRKTQYLKDLKPGTSKDIYNLINNHIITNFNVNKTMFVGEKLISLPDAKINSENKYEISISNVLFAANISVIPNANVEGEISITSDVIIEVPNTVAEIQSGAFNHLDENVILQIASSTNLNEVSTNIECQIRIVESQYRSVKHNQLSIGEDIKITYENGEAKSIKGVVSSIGKDKIGKITNNQTDANNCLVQYLIPSLELQVGEKIKDFNKLKSFVIRRVNFGDLTKIIAVAVVEGDNGELFGYKLDNVGYITNLYCTTKDSAIFQVNKDSNSIKLEEVYREIPKIDENDNGYPTISLKLPDGFDQLANYNGAKFYVNYKIKVVKCEGQKTFIGTEYFTETSNSIYLYENDGDDIFNKEITTDKTITIDNISELLQKVNDFTFKNIKIIIEIESVEMKLDGQLIFIRYYN